jgi:hypothetical protein
MAKHRRKTMSSVRFTLLISTALALTLSFSGEISAQRRDRDKDKWEQLGCDEVGRRADRDVIKVGRREGRFEAIRLTASGNDVRVEDLKVVYANGQPDDISVRSELREGSETRALDLKGRDRGIDRIEIVTKRDYKGRGRGHAKVCVEARADDRHGRRG